MSAVTIHAPSLELPRRPAVVISFPGARRAKAGSRSSAPAAPAAPALRMTRRGRLAVTLLVAATLVLVTLLGARTALAGPATAAQETQAVTMTVMPGDTLWSIATQTSAGGDVRDRISEIRELNDLQSSQLVVGQELAVPVG